jgi:hypothetical protein
MATSVIIYMIQECGTMRFFLGVFFEPEFDILNKYHLSTRRKRSLAGEDEDYLLGVVDSTMFDEVPETRAMETDACPIVFFDY